MKEYTIKSVNRRGEWHSKYQKDSEPYNDMVDWAISLEGEEGWIKLSQKATTKPPEAGQTVNGEVLNETSSNGEPFKKFKKINPNFQQGGQSTGSANLSNLEQRLEYAIKLLEELSGVRPLEQNEPEDPFAGM